MNNAELKEILLNPRPIVFGDMILPGIDAIIWRRMRRCVLLERDIGIVQVESLDHAGSKYTINPKHIRLATPEEIQNSVIPEPRTMLDIRAPLLEVFSDWCAEQNVAETTGTFLVFLLAEDLINNEKAHDIVISHTRGAAKNQQS